VVVSRYSDGELNIMKGKGGIGLHTGNEDSSKLRELLLQSIAYKDQLVCINELKPKNIKNNDRWVNVQKKLARFGGHALYGGANWNIYDFQNQNDLLPNFFVGNVLVVGSQSKALQKTFNNHNIEIDCYETAAKRVSGNYKKLLAALMHKVTAVKYDNILFCCGPVGKIWLTKLVNICNSNLVDIGSLINAIISGDTDDRSFVKKWNMSWANGINLCKLSKLFFNNIKLIK